MSIFKKKNRLVQDGDITPDSTIPTEETNVDSPAEEKKIKTIAKNVKSRILTNGKDSAINFFLKRIFTCLLSAILSAAIVLFTQHSFKDNFKDYIKDFVSVHIEEFTELVNHAVVLEDMDFEEAQQYCKENDIYEKSKNLMKVAISYNSEDKDITILHSSFKDVCEDILDLSVMLYAYSSEEDASQEVSDEVLVISGLILDASSNMNLIAPSKDASRNEESKEDSEYHIAMMQLKAKLEIFVDLSNELCKKHGIDPFI